MIDFKNNIDTNNESLNLAIRRKRLGQYNSGAALGRLLAALVEVDSTKTIIDPMAGKGDLLASCLALGAKKESLYGIEIDPIAYKLCSEIIGVENIVLGNSFKKDSIFQFSNREWDIVITNPPYIRYQSLSKFVNVDIDIPSAEQIRKDLVNVIEIIPALDKNDRILFKKMANQYSGLADMAVPSLILCTAMVTLGGKIALVLPESWLSRDFAAVVQYILLRWFEIEFIIEDEHAAWFSDAQVKTNLLIARRVPRKKSAFEQDQGKTFLKIRLSKKANGSLSIVENIYKDKNDQEILFATQARKWLNSGNDYKDEFISAIHVSLHRMEASSKNLSIGQKWYTGMEEDHQIYSSNSSLIPQELANWLESNGSNLETLLRFKNLGVKIGQGLRTGANKFFYLEIKKEDETTVELIPNKMFGIDHITIPKSLALPVLRRQSDLPKGYLIRTSDLKGRVLALQNVALPEDLKIEGNGSLEIYNPMTEELSNLVRIATKINFGSKSYPKLITELTAISPNVRRANPPEGILPRFWYMMPEFKNRHRPSLLIPRVNNESPKTFLNENRIALVDANFSTIWFDNESILDSFSILSLLNSSWSVVVLESIAAVMGGGALKVDATHLRRLPIPDFKNETWGNLSNLGKNLSNSIDTAHSKELLDLIDKVIISDLLSRSASYKNVKSLQNIAGIYRNRRKSQKS